MTVGRCTPLEDAAWRDLGSLLSNVDNGELGRLGTEIDDLLENLPTGRRPENLPSVHYENEYFCDLFLSYPRSRTDMSCRHVYLDLELN